ncbi:MAG: RES domain-containing protein [Bacteroidota bacterium]|nr:RES domain-containing protein [Bacteroidota bacterium]
MITVYRFAPVQFANDLSGEGARLFGGRWNSQGFPAVYCSFTISLALVELFIHKRTYEEIKVNQLMEIEIGSTVDAIIDYKKLKTNWQQDENYCQFMGNEFLSDKNHLALKVPSSVIEQELNIVLNPLAKDFSKKIKIKKISTFNFDNRLFK